jgi:hypothetical protein
MTLPEPDDEFETFLKRRTVLPNGMSDDDKVEPPKALDAIVLQKAREAIRATQRLNRAPRWATPVALAATILLCLSIVLNVSLNTNRPAPNLRQMTAATADTTSPAPANPASPASEGERREKAAAGTSSHEAILPEAKIVESRAPRPPVEAEAAAPSPSPPQRANASAADKAEVLASRTHAAAQAPSEAPPAANAAAAAPPHPQDPKAWLQHIAALRAEGKTAQADAEMQRFRATFPDYPAKPSPPAPSEPPK